MTKRRVVITGLGIVASIGNNAEEVKQKLIAGESGIEFAPDHEKYGFRSHVAGTVKLNPSDLIDRKHMRFMGDAAAYAYLAMQQAIQDSGLTEEAISNPRTGLIVGSGGSSSENIYLAAQTTLEKGAKRVGPYFVTKTMCSTTSACLSTFFKIKGINYSISSACATSVHTIGHAFELIQNGSQDRVFAGGSEELSWATSVMFDGMTALSSNHNNAPKKASRPYDKNRDGFVIAGGGGMVILEDYETAVKRNAKIYAEIIGYGANSDGFDMVLPSGEGAIRCMEMALATVKDPIDYINTHGTSTPGGDAAEIKAIKAVFKDKIPFISSTKSMTGHSLGATGVHEVIYSLLMMNHDFIAPSINIDEIDPEFENLPIVKSTLRQPITTVMSNSFGFGGTNGTIVLKKI